MNPFLKAKHWQLFTLFFGIPLILQVVWMNYFISIAQDGIDQDMLDQLLSGFPVLVSFGAFLLAILLGWYASVAIGLRVYTPKKLRLNLRPFYLACLFPIVHISFFLSIVYRLLQKPDYWDAYASNAAITFFFIAHVLAMGCIFYIPYYTAKAYKIAVLGRKVKREELVTEFLMMWFLFIGIWFVQPKINQLANGPLIPDHPSNAT